MSRIPGIYRRQGRLIVPTEHKREGPRHRRIREHNEQLAAAARSHRFDDDVPVPFLCECDDDECQDYVPLTLPEFDEWSETLTFTAPDHQVADATTLSRTHAYTLHMTEPL